MIVWRGWWMVGGPVESWTINFPNVIMLMRTCGLLCDPHIDLDEAVCLVTLVPVTLIYFFSCLVRTVSSSFLHVPCCLDKLYSSHLTSIKFAPKLCHWSSFLFLFGPNCLQFGLFPFLSAENCVISVRFLFRPNCTHVFIFHFFLHQSLGYSLQFITIFFFVPNCVQFIYVSLQIGLCSVQLSLPLFMYQPVCMNQTVFSSFRCLFTIY